MESEKICGPLTTELWSVFRQHSGSSGVLNREQTRTALNTINIFPSFSQVTELVHCACECAGRAPVDHITFGEFCFLVAELREHYKQNEVQPLPVSVNTERVVWQKRERRKRALAQGEAANFKVFLGGSCNPTTWRTKKAIPYLKSQGITYYNPQVAQWQPELMELEDQAKQTAELLFFVIDNQTRSTASMVEAAYLAGCGRQLILIVKEFEQPVIVYGETLSDLEVEDLERSHAFLTDLVERQTIPVFDDIDTALKCTAKCVQNNLHVSQLTVDDGVQPIKCPHIRVADKFMKLKDAFHAVDAENSGKVTSRDMQLAYKSMTSEQIPTSALSNSTAYTFEDFCLFSAEFKYKRKSWWERLILSLTHLSLRTLQWWRGQPALPPPSDASSTRRRDVFLGGTCGSSTWRQDLAVPAFKKHGISYYDPQLRGWSTRYIPLEAAVKDNCRLLLYVITSDTRGVSSMLEVGHYIGQGCDIVLCIQYLKEPCVLEGETLSSNAVKDYNRARAYLSDLANRDGIPVVENVEEAIELAVAAIKK